MNLKLNKKICYRCCQKHRQKQDHQPLREYRKEFNWAWDRTKCIYCEKASTIVKVYYWDYAEGVEITGEPKIEEFCPYFLEHVISETE